MGDNWAYTEGTSLTFTADAEPHLISVNGGWKAGGTGAKTCTVKLDGAQLNTPSVVSTGSGQIGYYLTLGFFQYKTLTAGSRTITVETTGSLQNCRIFAIKAALFPARHNTDAGNQSTASTGFVDLATLQFTVPNSGDYLIVASCLTKTTLEAVIHNAEWRLIDEGGVEHGKSGGQHPEALAYRQWPQTLVMKRLTLEAGSHIFKFQGKSSSGSYTAGFDGIHIAAVKLPEAASSYAANESSGTGTRATLNFTGLNGREYFIFDSSQLATDVAGAVRTLKRGDTTIGEEGSVRGAAGYQFSCSGSLEFIGTGASESFTTSSSQTVYLSRIIALDLTLLTEVEEDIPTQPIASPTCYMEPIILAEVYPPLDWEGDVLPNALLPVVTGKAVQSSGFEVSWFAIQAADRDGRIESLLRYFDPIWIWVQAGGVVERYLYRIESFERVLSSDGWTVDIRGRSWGGALLAQRGFTADKTFSEVEISDAIVNPTYGLIPTQITELGCGLYVRNVGRNITVTHVRGTKAKAALDDYKSYASEYTSWGHWSCSGDDKDEFGKPQLHFDKVSRDVSPIELIVGKTLFWAQGKSIFEFANWQDICYGPWGSEADKIAQPDLGPDLDKYSETNADTEQSLYNASVIAAGQALTLPQDKIIDEAEFYLRKQGSPTGNYVAKLYRASGTVGTDGIPSGNPISTTVEKAISQLTTTKQNIRLPFISPRIGMKGEKYVVAVEYSGGDATNYLIVGCDASSPTHGGNYCSKTGTTWTANSGRDLCFYLHSAEHQVGVSPEYRRLVAPGASEAETLAQTLVDAKGVPSIYHVVHTPFTHGVKENSRILILDPLMLLPQIARVNKRAFTIDYDDDGYKRAYLEVTLGGLSFGSTLL